MRGGVRLLRVGRDLSRNERARQGGKGSDGGWLVEQRHREEKRPARSREPQPRRGAGPEQDAEGRELLAQAGLEW